MISFWSLEVFKGKFLKNLKFEATCRQESADEWVGRKVEGALLPKILLWWDMDGTTQLIIT